MTKMRVHELAKELGVDNKDLMEALKKKDVEVKSHMSSLEDNVVADLKKEFGKSAGAEKAGEKKEEAPKKKTFARSTANSRKTSARQKDELEDMADDWDDEPEVKSTRSTQAHTSSRSTRKATPYGRSSKIVPMHSNIASRSMEVCVSKPDEFDTCQEICDIILSGRAAIINFDAVTTQEAQRIID